jgi:hypothetical protein
LWYYQELLKVYRDRGSHKGMVEELSDAINALTDAVGVSSTSGTDN